MQHLFDITDNYPTMIHFDELIGLNHYISIPEIPLELPNVYEVHLENIAVNLYSDQIPYQQILQSNPECFIKDYEDPTVLLKKAKLKVTGVKSGQVAIIIDGQDYFQSWKTLFHKNDLYFLGYGHSLDFINAYTYIGLIYSGQVELSFDDTDMLLHSYEYEVAISNKEIESMNKEKLQKIMINHTDKNRLVVNNKVSRLWDRNYRNKFFIKEKPLYRYKAVRDYDGTDE